MRRRRPASSCCAAVAGWIAYTAVKPRTIEFRDWTLVAARPGATLASIAVGTADTAAAALALWFILPDSADITFPAFLVVFAVATVLGVLSHVPGGFGIFDAAILLGLPQVPEPAMLASLLVFRLVYYVGPLALSGLMLSIYEVSRKDTPVNKGFTALAQIANPLLPAAAAISVFLGGFVLLISGALPAEADRIAALRRLIPLPFVETSHFIASVVGALLLVVAHGLLRRLKSAWTLAMALLLVGSCVLRRQGLRLRGSDHLPCRGRDFSTPGDGGSIDRADFSPGRSRPRSSWPLRSPPVLRSGSASWSTGRSPTTIRCGGISPITETPRASSGPRSASRSRYSCSPPTGSCTGRRACAPPHRSRKWNVRAPMVATNDRVEANLATLGDKRFMFANDGGEGFVMYGVQGTSWIAMGDPVTRSPAVAADLVWQFKELVDEHRGVPVFYQVTTPMLPVYLDAGFSLVKLGEEAWVDLKQFTLEGGEGRKLRQTKSKAERSGATLEFVPAEKVDKLIPQLERVSNAWIEERGQREKGFSLGFWSETYLSRCDLAIIRHEGRIVAFANIWTTGQKEEFSIDLMRHLPDAPQGTMDLLLIGLMEHAKANGYRWFNLGMAPLSGPAAAPPRLDLEPGRNVLSPACRQALQFRRPQSLQEQVQPEWRAKYLAYPGGLSLPQVLLDVTTLISSSPKRAAQALADVE